MKAQVKRANLWNDGTEPLLLKTEQACRVLGGVAPRTLKRWEERGLIRPVVGLLRHKLYALEDLRALVADLKGWTAQEESRSDGPEVT